MSLAIWLIFGALGIALFYYTAYKPVSLTWKILLSLAIIGGPITLIFACAFWTIDNE